jgi:Xaa-Pro aminopeptidase
VVGGPTARQEAVHDALVDALDAAVAAVEPGRPISGIYEAAAGVVADAGYAEAFMGRDQVGFEYVGHAVGLDIDESPLLTPGAETPIEPGMVFAIEPKVLFVDEFGITLEDTVLATDDGARRLTRSPRRLGTI